MVDGFVITGAFLNEHVAVPVIKAGEFIHKKARVCARRNAPVIASGSHGFERAGTREA